jgi:hypothetical protein
MPSDVPADPNRAVAQWIPAVDGPLPTSGGVLGGSTVNQGAPNVSTTNAWHVKSTDAAGTNQQAITAAGDAKVTLDGEVVEIAASTPLSVTFADPGFKFARINAISSGLTTVVAAVGGKIIRVIGYTFSCNVAVQVSFQDTAGTPLTGAQSFASTGGIVWPGGVDCPAFESAVGEGMQIGLSAVAEVQGHLTYVEI